VAEFDRVNGITVFVDGVPKFTAGSTTGSVDNAIPLLIGHESRTGYPYFNGTIDDVAIYSGLLSAARVQDHYESGAGIDVTPPSLTLTAPADGGNVVDTTPTFGGSAGSDSGDLSTVTVKIYSGGSVTGTPVQTAAVVRAGGSWAVDTSPVLTPGTYTARAEQQDVAGNTGFSASSTFTVTAPPAPPATDPTLLVAGDIADCLSNGDEATEALLGLYPSATVMTLGDNAYDSGTDSEYTSCYNPSWGHDKARTHPIAGNHEYLTVGAAGYFNYFGAAAGDPTKGYYSYDLGAWHVIVLNSNCSAVGGCQAGSPQEQWVRADLAAHTNSCTIAAWHHPLFSSGVNGNNVFMQPIWQDLYNSGADVVLNGHDHNYERFAPQTASGTLDLSRGISEFIVGTGGKSQTSILDLQPNSEVQHSGMYGILKLDLHQNGYDWQFVPISGGTFQDFGSRVCH
jgi:hypothetical protein